MHEAAFQALGLPHRYLAFAVAPEGLPEAIAGLKALGFGGANLTLPHKRAVLPLVDGLTPAAERLGAVNTLFWQDGALWGDNTDLAGARACLPQAGLGGASALVLGAGGAARAAVAALQAAGAGRIQVLARRPEEAEALLKDLGVAEGGAIAWGEAAARRQALAEAAWLLQATSLGLDGQGEVLAPEDLACLPAAASVFDLVYHPRETALVRAARARGLAAEDGRRMLVAQAEAAFARWVGQAPPAGVMAQALGSLLAARLAAEAA